MSKGWPRDAQWGWCILSIIHTSRRQKIVFVARPTSNRAPSDVQWGLLEVAHRKTEILALHDGNLRSPHSCLHKDEYVKLLPCYPVDGSSKS